MFYCASVSGFVLWLVASSVAEEQPKSDYTSYPTLTALAAKANGRCFIISTDCQVCAVADGTVTCSSVGIACEPKEWRCYPRTTHSSRQ